MRGTERNLLQLNHHVLSVLLTVSLTVSLMTEPPPPTREPLALHRRLVRLRLAPRHMSSGGFSRLRLTAQSCLSVLEGLGGSSLVAAWATHTTQDSVCVCVSFLVVELLRRVLQFFSCVRSFLRCTGSNLPPPSALLTLSACEVVLQGHS